MIEGYADLAGRVASRPPRLGSVRLVAIDGPSGAGKSRFADRLARALRDASHSVALIHIDDLLDGWDDQVTFWPRLEEQVLGPLRATRPGRYHRYDWQRGRFAEAAVSVPVIDVLVVEGVTSARAAIRAELSYSVFVTAPAPLRLSRAIARDGEIIRTPLARWRRNEEAFFAADNTMAAVDLVVDGAPTTEHDPEREYLRR